MGPARRTHGAGAGWEARPGLRPLEGPAALPPLPAPVRPALPAAPPHVPRLRLSPRRRRRRTSRTGRREGLGRGCGLAGGGGDSGAEGPPTPRPARQRPRPYPRPCAPSPGRPCGAVGAASAARLGSAASRIPDLRQLLRAPGKGGVVGRRYWDEVPSRKGSWGRRDIGAWEAALTVFWWRLRWLSGRAGYPTYGIC